MPVTKQKGFTLIELIVVVVIIAILAVIAIPSYRKYVIRNAESEAKSQMQQVQVQLERWRSSTLSYKDFYPKNGIDSSTGKPDYKYSDIDNKIIYIPINSTASDYKYQITLVDSSNNSLTNANSTGRAWKMLAEPRTNGSVSSGHIFKMDSTGYRCQSKDRGVGFSKKDCGTGSESW